MLPSLLGFTLLVTLVWWRIDPEGCPRIIKILGPLAFAVWLFGHIYRNFG